MNTFDTGGSGGYKRPQSRPTTTVTVNSPNVSINARHTGFVRGSGTMTFGGEISRSPYFVHTNVRVYTTPQGAPRHVSHTTRSYLPSKPRTRRQRMSASIRSFFGR